MRIAYFSPLPPQRSGIADYSEELLPFLARDLEVECFSERAGEALSASRTGLPIHQIEAFSQMQERFDLALYHLGNNPDYHATIFHQLMRKPGVVVLHEYMLHHLMRGLTVARGDTEAYVEEMRYAYGPTGQRLARREFDTGLPVDTWRYPLFERVVDRSLATVVHNDHAKRRIQASRPDALVGQVPFHMGVTEPPAERPDEIRDRFGIPPGDFLVGSYGFITKHKRLEVSLRAFAEFRRRYPQSSYLVVGEVSPFYDLEALSDEGMGQGVVMTGRVSMPVLLASMNACDAAINLRYPTGGETSATLMRLLGLGKPVVVSDHGSFAEVPDGCCAKVGLDDGEEAVLTAYLSALATDADLRRQMGENARRYMLEEHSLESAATAYVEFLRHVAGVARQPFKPFPPLSAEARSVWGRIVGTVGAAIADLGVPDSDRELLDEVAGTIDDLGLTCASVEGRTESGEGRS
jgi:glycosyltransferase involved in cell wall biosynthesis